MKKYLSSLASSLLVFTTVILLTGCAMGNTSIAKEDLASVASKITLGRTTQSEVLQIYGQPMYRQTNSDGTETWTYSTMDTSFKTYVPFVPLITGNDGTQGKDLSIKFNQSKIVISQDFTQINNNSRAVEANDRGNKNQKNIEQTPHNSKAKSDNSSARNSTSTNDLIGIYENRSESEFIFTLQIEKNGSAIYEEPDLETGRSIKLRGNWKKDGDDLVLNFGKKGSYRYSVKQRLSWAAFGCKGESFGLENKSTPRSKKRDSSHDVWRKVDMKKADTCQPA